MYPFCVHKEYIELIKQLIDDNEAERYHDDTSITWEFVKMDIRSATAKYIKYKKSINLSLEQKLVFLD